MGSGLPVSTGFGAHESQCRNRYAHRQAGPDSRANRGSVRSGDQVGSLRSSAGVTQPGRPSSGSRVSTALSGSFTSM